MRIGIGLPNAVPGVTGALITEWASRAERAGFASLATIDRIVYDSFDPLLALTAAAAVTTRVELMTTVLIGPVRPTALLAKQAATLDQLSDGRLTLGIGLGGRDDDFTAAGVPMAGRGRRFDRQLDELRRIWDGERRGTDGPIGPAPVRSGGPPLLIGGDARYAAERVARHRAGWTLAVAGGQGDGGIADPAEFAAGKTTLAEAWARHGHADAPRVVAVFCFSLGADAIDHARRERLRYYAWRGDAVAARVAAATATTPAAVRELGDTFTAAGADDIIAMPCQPNCQQIDLLASAVGSRRVGAPRAARPGFRRAAPQPPP
jgi:alkanesulfonate monooxygenase SsuD/methylene tetrahydromethanopterin reductase-like flavin-dependent oxidoreductase (luciferase family)